MEYEYLKDTLGCYIEDFDSKMPTQQLLDGLDYLLGEMDFLENYAIKGFMNNKTGVISIAALDAEGQLFLEVFELC